MTNSNDYAWYSDGVKQIFAPKSMHPVTWPTCWAPAMEDVLRGIFPEPQDRYHGSFDFYRPEVMSHAVERLRRAMEDLAGDIRRPAQHDINDELRAQYFGSFDRERAPLTATAVRLRQEMRRAWDLAWEPFSFIRPLHARGDWRFHPTRVSSDDLVTDDLESGEVGLKCCEQTFERFAAYMSHRRCAHRL